MHAWNFGHHIKMPSAVADRRSAKACAPFLDDQQEAALLDLLQLRRRHADATLKLKQLHDMLGADEPTEASLCDETGR